jgi:hypothetical protein
MLGGLESSGMTPDNKVRLIAMYIISQRGVTDEVRRQLVATAGRSSVAPDASFPTCGGEPTLLQLKVNAKTCHIVGIRRSGSDPSGSEVSALTWLTTVTEGLAIRVRLTGLLTQ